MIAYRIAIFLIVMIVASSTNTSAQIPDFVTATYSLDKAYVLVTLNGFPVLNDTADYSSSGGGPVNLHLVPTGNRLEIRFEPLAHNGEESSFLSFSVGSTGQGEVVDTGEAGDLVNVDLNAGDGAQTLVETFDLPPSWRDGFDTGRIYQDAVPITDEAMLRAYALRLFEMIKSGDYAAFAREALPRIRAYRDAFAQSGLPSDAAGLEAAFVQTIAPALESLSLHTDVHEGNVKLIPWAEGRLWEARLDDGKALIHATDNDGGVLSLDIYIAHVDGALRVVR